jgi:uncharacterized protein with HEPN domain
VSERLWRFYIEDMLTYAEQVLEYTQACDQASFIADRMRYDATVRKLELIGEAATHVPESERAAHPEVPWRKIVALRNALIHGYLGIDNDVLWSVVRNDVSTLPSALRAVLERDIPDQG